MKHLKCYGKHMVGKHLALLQYFNWGRHFKDGNTLVINKARSGRPSTVVTDVSIAKAAELLENDRSTNFRLLCISPSNALNTL